MRSPQVIVITGASSGIGRASALAFAAKGAKLVLASRRLDALRIVAEECEQAGAAGALAVETDVTSNKSVKALARAAVERFGQIDVWVNNAGASVIGTFLEVPLDDFRKVLDVNVMGTVYGARAALRIMTQQGHGSLVNVSSIVGEVPQPYASAYSMSKAAVRSLGVSLRQELSLARERHISVSTILPPAIDTPFFRHAANYSGRRIMPPPPVYPPSMVADAIVRAASHPKPEIVVSSTGKTLVRSHRMKPGPVEAQMALLTEKKNLSPTESASDTRGALFEPAGTDDATVTGGWNGRARTTRRRLFTAAVVLGAGGLLVRLLRARS